MAGEACRHRQKLPSPPMCSACGRRNLSFNFTLCGTRPSPTAGEHSQTIRGVSIRRDESGNLSEKVMFDGRRLGVVEAMRETLFSLGLCCYVILNDYGSRGTRDEGFYENRVFLSLHPGSPFVRFAGGEWLFVILK
jgi:hypothetical protein